MCVERCAVDACLVWMRRLLINPWWRSGVSGHTRVKPGVHYNVSSTRFVCESGVNHLCRHFSPFFHGREKHTFWQPAGCGKHTWVPVGLEEQPQKRSQNPSWKQYLFKGIVKHLGKYAHLFSVCLRGERGAGVAGWRSGENGEPGSVQN